MSLQMQITRKEITFLPRAQNYLYVQAGLSWYRRHKHFQPKSAVFDRQNLTWLTRKDSLSRYIFFFSLHRKVMRKHFYLSCCKLANKVELCHCCIKMKNSCLLFSPKYMCALYAHSTCHKVLSSMSLFFALHFIQVWILSVTLCQHRNYLELDLTLQKESMGISFFSWEPSK